MSVIAPGAVIGILGGGQLGRMLALAAAALGYRCHVFTPESDAPASHVARATTVAPFADRAALADFAAAVAVVTLEFENIPVETLAWLAERVPVRPGADVLRVTQDRLLEKEFVVACGGATAPYRQVASAGELAAAVAALGCPAILKTRRFGYDGKGQIRIAAPGEAAAAWDKLAPAPCILEGFVPFRRELSVIVARGPDGAMAHYPPVENEHADHILARTLAPAVMDDVGHDAAVEIARTLAGRLGVVGLLAVELFETVDGRILVNEMAPRTHNSGHWTIEGATTGQFEQQVRAICGLPLGDPHPRGRAEMRNLIGDQAADWPRLLADPRAKLHLYGKTEARPGRKMGHVTWVWPDP